MKKRIVSFVAACLTAFSLMGTPVSAATASAPAAGIVATATSGLNVRSSASLSSSILTSLPKGTAVELISRSGSWWRVRYGSNSYGYCSAAYIDEVEGSFSASVATVSGRLNVRKGPSTSYSILTSLEKGTAVTVLSQSNRWSKILFGGKTGYVSSSYLSSSGNSSSGNTSSNGAVSLNIPDYKQTDSRWSSVQIGSYGETIGQIGCTTTALAMTESYRLKQTIYPDEMSRRLTYTPGGALYWPTTYKQSTASGDLNFILSLLRQGTPVIYGAKTASGGQHWVVVTGYNGKGLSAENFTINDPGSRSRTTLQQFLNAYPRFYKLAWAG